MEKDEGCRGEQSEEQRSTSSGTLLPDKSAGQPSSCPQTTDNPTEEESAQSNPPLNQALLFRAIEVVERDSLAISESFLSLFSSLRLTLSEVIFYCHFSPSSFVFEFLFGENPKERVRFC